MKQSKNERLGIGKAFCGKNLSLDFGHAQGRFEEAIDGLHPQSGGGLLLERENLSFSLRSGKSFLELIGLLESEGSLAFLFSSKELKSSMMKNRFLESSLESQM